MKKKELNAKQDANGNIFDLTILKIVSFLKKFFNHDSNNDRKSPFKCFAGSGVCDVCNRGIGPNDAYLVPVKVFYGSKQYKNWLSQGPLSSMIKLVGGVDAYILNLRSMDSSTYSAVCSDCVHMFD